MTVLNVLCLRISVAYCVLYSSLSNARSVTWSRPQQPPVMYLPRWRAFYISLSPLFVSPALLLILLHRQKTHHVLSEACFVASSYSFDDFSFNQQMRNKHARVVLQRSSRSESLVSWRMLLRTSWSETWRLDITSLTVLSTQTQNVCTYYLYWRETMRFPL